MAVVTAHGHRGMRCVSTGKMAEPRTFKRHHIGSRRIAELAVVAQNLRHALCVACAKQSWGEPSKET